MPPWVQQQHDHVNIVAVVSSFCSIGVITTFISPDKDYHVANFECLWHMIKHHHKSNPYTTVGLRKVVPDVTHQVTVFVSVGSANWNRVQGNPRNNSRWIGRRNARRSVLTTRLALLPKNAPAKQKNNGEGRTSKFCLCHCAAKLFEFLHLIITQTSINQRVLLTKRIVDFLQAEVWLNFSYNNALQYGNDEIEAGYHPFTLGELCKPYQARVTNSGVSHRNVEKLFSLVRDAPLSTKLLNWIIN